MCYFKDKCVQNYTVKVSVCYLKYIKYRVVYFFMTLSSISAFPLKREKHPGLQSTQPIMCSVAF